MIHDAFTFRNELDILEVRLNVLAETVDRFILVEGDFTFQGGTKPLLFTENRDRFTDFLDRIVVVRMTGPVEADDPWIREKLQRNGILDGLKVAEAEPDDPVLIGDVDEIPNPEAIDRAAELLRNGAEQVAFEQRLSFYHVDNLCHTAKWYGTQAVSVAEAFRRSPEEVRQMRNTSTTIRDGGWHWCNLGDPEWLIEKIESFSHDEVNLPRYKDPAFLAQCIAEGREMTGRQDILFRHESDVELPAYLLENRDRFAHFFSP